MLVTKFIWSIQTKWWRTSDRRQGVGAGWRVTGDRATGDGRFVMGDGWRVMWDGQLVIGHGWRTTSDRQLVDERRQVSTIMQITFFKRRHVVRCPFLTGFTASMRLKIIYLFISLELGNRWRRRRALPSKHFIPVVAWATTAWPVVILCRRNLDFFFGCSREASDEGVEEGRFLRHWLCLRNWNGERFLVNLSRLVRLLLWNDKYTNQFEFGYNRFHPAISEVFPYLPVISSTFLLFPMIIEQQPPSLGYFPIFPKFFLTFDCDFPEFLVNSSYFPYQGNN